METDTRFRNRLVSVTMVFLLTTIILYWLIRGRAVLVPIAVSILVWYLLNALADGLGRLRIARRSLPGWARRLVALLLVVIAGLLVIQMLYVNVAALIEAAPRYEQRIEEIIVQTYDQVGAEPPPGAKNFADTIDLSSIAATTAGSVLNGLSGGVIIVFFVLFLFMEQAHFWTKVERALSDPARRDGARRFIDTVQREIKTYVWINFVMGIILGGISYVMMRVVGLDFAGFWAFMIFLLSFIPTIGTVLGIALPLALALLQFSTFGPFAALAGVLVPAQLLVNNYLGPRMMGKSLNLSPFLIFASLSIMGSVWGIVGAILAVPLMSIALIILATFPQTRRAAIIMSSDGDISSITRHL